jgi:soluble lytic murein transglycosylase-like protein
LLALLFLWPSLSQAGAYPIKYDLHFKHWGEFYFPLDDWRRWKAQGIAESRLDIKARSHCGAIGIMQLMPATAKELGANPFDAESNIQGGIKYDARLVRFWKNITSTDDRRNFVYASYNAGPGWIIKACKLGGYPWNKTAEKLPQVTGIHAKETVGYVKRINQIYMQIRNN